MEKLRFEVLQNIPSPYRLHMFNVMWQELRKRDISFYVHFMAQGHRERPKSWRNPRVACPHQFWKDIGWKSHHFNPGLLISLCLNPPHYLLVGSPYDTITGIMVALFVRAGVKIAWSEGNTKVPGRMKGFIGWFKRFILSRYDYVAVPGQEGRMYIQQHQAFTRRKMPNCLFLPNLIDETAFKSKKDWSEEVISEARKKMGAMSEQERILLIPARLSKVKGLEEFFFLLNPKILHGWRVFVLGEGELRENLIQLMKVVGIDSYVHICNYVPYNEMPQYYAAADVMFLPSRHDPNPLSVIEAMFSGTPVALSEMAGNVPETIVEGKTGWVLHVTQEARVKREIERILLQSRQHLRGMEDEVRRHISLLYSSQEAVSHFFSSVL